MDKKINLEEILNKELAQNKLGNNDCTTSILIAMREGISQALELAAENAKLIDIKGMNCENHTPYWGECQSCGSYHNYEITIGRKLDKQSILDIIKQVE